MPLGERGREREREGKRGKREIEREVLVMQCGSGDLLFGRDRVPVIYSVGDPPRRTEKSSPSGKS